MSKAGPSQVAPKLRKLAQVAHALRNGQRFAITRLTVVKSFCADPTAAAHFAVYLAQQAHAAMLQETRLERIPAERWATYHELVAAAIPAMEHYLAEPKEQGANELWRLVRELAQLQNEQRPIPFGVVRVIENTHALLVETALRVLLTPRDAAFWGYQLARDYADRYDPQYGSGLIPASAPAVEIIVDFWCRYYFGVGLDAWRRG